MLFIRGVGPIGYPGGAEVVNMQPPAALIKKGVHALPCIGDGRQSGTSGSPSILNASPEAAAGGGLALLKTGDRVRIDLNKGTADVLIPEAELAQRRAALEKQGGYKYPPSQTPWQEIQREMVDQLAQGMVLKPAVKYQRVAQKFVPRDNHCRADLRRALVLRDDRSRVEMIVHADAHDVLAKLGRRGDDDDRKAEGRDIHRPAAEIEIEILGLEGPVVPHHRFDAAAGRPADLDGRR